MAAAAAYRSDQTMNRALRIAIACGILPLSFGVWIFLAWLVTRWDGLMAAGLFTLYVGVGLFLIGAVAVGVFCWRGARSTHMSRRRLWLTSVACAVLLLSNFVVAGWIIATVIDIKTAYIVTIENETAEPLRDVRVSGGGCDVDFGVIPSGGRVQRTFWIQREGELEFRAVGGTTVYGEVIDGYVTNSMAGETSVTVKLDGTVAIRNDR